MGPWSLRMIQWYWYSLVMVARDIGYRRYYLKGYKGVTPGYPLSPTIFNVAVGAVL